MATKTAAATAEKPQTQGESNDSPLLDTINAAVKKMIAQGKERGFVTYDELNAALPPEQVSSEQIENTMSMLSEAGVNVVESEDSEESSDAAASAKEKERESTAGNVNESDVGRSDDPVRMYLREMGSVELLSREGEIAIAKRIEAGREMMIGGIVESPMTIRALLQWRKDLDEENMLLRDIIDLDATFSGPKEDATAIKPEGEEDKEGEEVEDQIAAAAPAVKEETEEDKDEDGEEKTEGEGEDDDDDDDDDGTVSLAVMEQTLLPTVLEKFDKIKKTYAKLHRAQEKRLAAIQAGNDVASAMEKRIAKLRRELVELMEGIHINNNRIEYLLGHMYDLNRKLISKEGRLLRMAVKAKVKRADFLKEYYSHELDPSWLT
ncbi:MAG: RNA polymerase sigma factor region1.1 domain-containing protein, partial [Rhodospirillales bacterium]|nr:RNA polymerase sigma factor region1.1 domain-containing protein [Rhodospirillales bacterium]